MWDLCNENSRCWSLEDGPDLDVREDRRPGSEDCTEEELGGVSSVGGGIGVDIHSSGLWRGTGRECAARLWLVSRARLFAGFVNEPSRASSLS